MITDINSEDRLVQRTFAQHLERALQWESVYAYNAETFGSNGTLGRASEREVVLVRDLGAALARLNPVLPGSAREQAVEKLTRVDFAGSLVQGLLQEVSGDHRRLHREKDRVTVEEAFAKLIELANSLDGEQQRAAREGLSDDELALSICSSRETSAKSTERRSSRPARPCWPA